MESDTLPLFETLHFEVEDGNPIFGVLNMTERSTFGTNPGMLAEISAYSALKFKLNEFRACVIFLEFTYIVMQAPITSNVYPWCVCVCVCVC